MRIILFLAALIALPAYAQIIGYEPGQEPPAGTFQPPEYQAPAGILPIIDVEMDPVGNAPYLQPAHNGRYTSSRGVLIYQHLANGSAIVTILLPDGRWAGAFGTTANQSQVLLPLYVGADQVGEVKLGTVATTGSPDPKARGLPKAGTPCGRLFARARLGTELVFPFDPNLNCSPGPGIPGQFCLIQPFLEKVGEFGPEACDLSR